MPQAATVLNAFMHTEMAQGNVLYDAKEAAAMAPMLRTEGACAAMYSPHELRVESSRTTEYGRRRTASES